MAFSYQNDIDSKMENYPLKLHNTLAYITAKLRKENYEYIILLLTSAIDAATRMPRPSSTLLTSAIDAATRVPRPSSKQYKSTCYIAEYIAEAYKMIDKCIKFLPRRP